jgi:hypothetical protein
MEAHKGRTNMRSFHRFGTGRSHTAVLRQDGTSDSSNIDTTQPVLPPPSVSSMSQAVKNRDCSCRLSGYQDQIECAHLCPRAELMWFRQQEMERYNIRQSLTGAALVRPDQYSNVRSDIHSEFDHCTFIFTRKRGVTSWTPQPKPEGGAFSSFVSSLSTP